MRLAQLLIPILLASNFLGTSLAAGDVQTSELLSTKLYSYQKKTLKLATEAMGIAAKSNQTAKTKSEIFDARACSELGWNLKEAFDLLTEIADLQWLIENSNCPDDRAILVKMSSKRSNLAKVQIDMANISLQEFCVKTKSKNIRHQFYAGVGLLTDISNALNLEMNQRAERPNPPLKSDPACIAFRSLSSFRYPGSVHRLGAGVAA